MLQPETAALPQRKTPRFTRRVLLAQNVNTSSHRKECRERGGLP